jgi:hypothetical protein
VDAGIGTLKTKPIQENFRLPPYWPETEVVLV